MIFGRPETFAIEVNSLAGGPEDGDPGASCTWTSMRIYIENQNILQNMNRRDQSVSEDINWPVINLARWLVRSWNELFHTGAWPIPSTHRNARDIASKLDARLAEDFDIDDEEIDRRDDFVASHSLRAAASGAALPDLWISRDAEIVSLAWNDSWEGEIGFPLSRGERDVPAVDFAQAIQGFVTWILELLKERCPSEGSADIDLLAGWLDRFSDRRGATEALLSETGIDEERARLVAKVVGVEGSLQELFGLDEGWFAKGTFADVRESSIAVAFRCAAPVVTNDELATIRQKIVAANANPKALAALQKLAARIPRETASARDYERGYRLARRLREALGNTSGNIDVEALLGDLHVDIVELDLSDSEIDGGCVCDSNHGPLVFVNPGSAKAAMRWGRRMVLAHELCHLLFDRKSAVALGVMSGPWAPPRIERTANAFAIELLLPMEGIRKTVGAAWDKPDDSHVETLMAKYGLGITAVTRHLHNLSSARNRQ